MKKQTWYGTIYLLTNSVNSKQYVGQTIKNYEERWSQHITDARGKSQQLIHRAIRKYGVEKFSTVALQNCRSLATLDKAEVCWIKKLHTIAPWGYNLTLGGRGMAGYKDSESTRNKKSAALERRWATDREAIMASLNTLEAKANTSAAQKLRFESAEAHELASLAAIAWINDPQRNGKYLLSRESSEFSAAVSAGQYKRFADPVKAERHRAAMQRAEYRALMKLISTARFADPTQLAAHKAAYKTEAAIRNCSEGQIKRFTDPEEVAKNSAWSKARWDKMTPAERKAYWHSIHPNGNGHGRSKQ